LSTAFGDIEGRAAVAKRFTDSDKWKNPAFREMPNDLRWFWIYLLDNCDAAGIWRVDFAHASFSIGLKISSKHAEEYFCEDGKAIVIDHDKWFIPSFVTFQYGDLKEDSRPHQSVIKILVKNGIDPKTLTLSKGYLKSIHTLKDKEQEQDKDQEQEKEEVVPEKSLFEWWNENRGPFSAAEKNTDKRKTHAKAQFEKYPEWSHWETVLAKWKRSEFCKNQWKPTFDDFLNENKRIATLEGKYDNRGDQKAPAKQTNWSEKALEVWDFVSGAGPMSPETWELAKTIGIEKLQQMHRDDFRHSGIVPGLLKQAAEKMGAA
jgi:hypothetical protein